MSTIGRLTRLPRVRAVMVMAAIFASTGGRGIWQFTESNGSAYQTAELVFKVHIPAVAKGRAGSIC